MTKRRKGIENETKKLQRTNGIDRYERGAVYSKIEVGQDDDRGRVRERRKEGYLLSVQWQPELDRLTLAKVRRYLNYPKMEPGCFHGLP